MSKLQKDYKLKNRRRKEPSKKGIFKRRFMSVKLITCRSLLGGNREREIPEPIPNSEVKPLIANGTAHKSVGE